MLLSLRYNLARLAVFSGRESVGRFWPYAGIVILLLFVGMGAVMLPVIADSLTRMQQFAAAHPDQATVTTGPGTYSVQIQGSHPELLPDMGGFAARVGIVTVVAVLLLAAAVARRLHDRGRSGLWGLLPLPFLAFGLLGMNRLFASFGPGAIPDFRLFGALFLNNLVYLGSLLLLVIQLASSGMQEPNRYGDITDA